MPDKEFSISAGTLYEINKTILKDSKKVLRGKALTNAIDKSVNPFLKKCDYCSYLMLLSNDKRYYTIFHAAERNFNEEKCKETFKLELRNCLSYCGEILSMELTDSEDAIEIWIRDEQGEVSCYYLFPYDAGVIEL